MAIPCDDNRTFPAWGKADYDISVVSKQLTCAQTISQTQEISQTQTEQARMSRLCLSNIFVQAVSLYSDSEKHSRQY